MRDLSINIAGSIVSAVIIALMFSIWSDFIYKKDRLSGYWKVESEMTDASYKPYIGLEIYYDFVIGQNGNSLVGRGEKTGERSKGKYREYNGKFRTHLEFEGSLTYKAFSENQVDIIYREIGQERASSTILNLIVVSENKMEGTYISTISSSKGKITFTKMK